MSEEAHKHPEENESRAQELAGNEDLDVNLNFAEESILAELSIIGSDRARVLVQNRPLESWADVEKLPGFSKNLVEDLQNGGAHL